MQQHFDGIPRPLSSRPASITVTVCLTFDGLVHHLEFEVRGISGNLLAASAAPGGQAPTPNAVLAWAAAHLMPILEEELEPFRSSGSSSSGPL